MLHDFSNFYRAKIEFWRFKMNAGQARCIYRAGSRHGVVDKVGVRATLQFAGFVAVSGTGSAHKNEGKMKQIKKVSHKLVLMMNKWKR